MVTLNHTHDPAARSWVENAENTDFPIQNLPIAVFRNSDGIEAFRGGIAIGDQIIDLARVTVAGCLEGLAADAALAASHPYLNDFMAMGPEAWQALRHALFDLLKAGAEGEKVEALRGCLTPMKLAQFTVPCRIGDYTDFYTSVYHATNIGRLFRPDNPLMPNFKWIPIGYHGRSSTIGVSGQTFHRPLGQTMPPGAEAPSFGPCRRLDYELEIGIFMGTGNKMGQPISIEQAEEHVFGICLLNDWSARDVQAWEYQPLGPFLAKNFATTISPWIVSMEALAPFRQAWSRDAADPQPLPYLESTANREAGGLDIQLEVQLQTPQRQAAGVQPAKISQTSFRHQYWSVAQMVAHHTVGGCDLQPGDLLGSGTISGPVIEEAGAMIELTQSGKNPLSLPTEGGAPAEQRGFLEDGDSVIIRGWCEKPGAQRIGFGVCAGTVLPAIQAA